ncbi:MAG: Gfo/Idh/MocA family oxidoreductase [Nitrospirae bacterium]|nr:Gfo/Idh/MocA family oxidoreductase [Nitrospirota bacterium]
MSLKVGVIGVGYLGRHHARIYSELPGVELVAVADCNREQAEKVAQDFGCGVHTKYEDMIGACDALSIVTNTTTHHAIALDCIRAGKDLLIEKPIASDLRQAREIVEEAERRNVLIQIGHLERYNPGIKAASAMINSPSFIESRRMSPFMGRADDVDVTIDLMIHDIDIVLSLVPSRLMHIRAIGESVITDKIDFAKAWLEFTNGCTALISASRIASEKVRTLTVFQQDSFVEIDYQKQEVMRHFKADRKVTSEHIRPETREPLKEELKDFVSCVIDRRRPDVSGVEGMNALEVALRITDILKAGCQACRQ